MKKKKILLYVPVCKSLSVTFKKKCISVFWAVPVTPVHVRLLTARLPAATQRS